MPNFARHSRFWLVILLYALVFTLSVFVLQRPYYLSPADGEANYFYNAALIALGKSPSILTHPGVTQYYLAGWLLRVLGFDESHLVSRTQFYLHAMHVLGFVLAIGSWLISWRLLRRSYESGAIALAFLLCFLNPTLLAWCLDYYGPETIMVAVTPLLMSVFLTAISRPPSWGWAISLGVVSAFALDVKIAMVVVVLPVLVGYTAYVLMSSGSKTKNLLLVAGVGASLASVLLALLLPVRPLWMEIARVLFMDRKLSPSGAVAQMAIIGDHVSALWHFSGLTVILVIALFVMIVFGVREKLRSFYRTGSPSMEAHDLALCLFAVMLVGAWVYIFQMAGVHGENLFTFGMYFRNPLPLYLATPFLVLPFLVSMPNGSSRLLSGRAVFLAVFGLAIAYIAFFFVQREQAISELKRENQEMEAFFARESERGRMGVYYDHGFRFFPTQFLFHYRGSYVYGGSHFDSVVNESYPKISLFDLPNIDLFLSHKSPTPETHYKSHTGGLSERQYSPMHPSHFDHAFQLLSGREEPSPEKIIINDNLEFLEYRPFERVAMVIKERYGLTYSKSIQIGESRFFVFDRDGNFVNQTIALKRNHDEPLRVRGVEQELPRELAADLGDAVEYRQEAALNPRKLDTLKFAKGSCENLLVDLRAQNYFYTKNFFLIEGNPSFHVIYKKFPYAVVRLK